MSRNTKIKLYEKFDILSILKKAHIFQLNRTEWSKWVVNLIQFAHMKHNQIFIRFPLLFWFIGDPWRFLFFYLFLENSSFIFCTRHRVTNKDCIEGMNHLFKPVCCSALLLGFGFKLLRFMRNLSFSSTFISVRIYS